MTHPLKIVELAQSLCHSWATCTSEISYLVRMPVLSATLLIYSHGAFWVTGSSDSDNGMRNNVSNRKNVTSAGPNLPPVDSEAMRSRQLPPPPADRCLPKPPAVHDLQNVNADMNASRQSFRLAMGNACKLHISKRELIVNVYCSFISCFYRFSVELVWLCVCLLCFFCCQLT